MKNKDRIQKEWAERRKREGRERLQLEREIIAGDRHPGGLLKTESERQATLHPDDPRW